MSSEDHDPAGRESNEAGNQDFPYLAAPNLDLHMVLETIDVSATPEKVWELIGQFGGHPLIVQILLTGTGPGQLRTIETIDGEHRTSRCDG